MRYVVKLPVVLYVCIKIYGLVTTLDNCLLCATRQAEMRDQLDIGSYPVTKQPDGVGIILSLEAKDPQVRLISLLAR